MESWIETINHVEQDRLLHKTLKKRTQETFSMAYRMALGK